MRHRLLIIIVLLAVALAVAGVVYAAVSWQRVPFDMTIKPSPPAVASFQMFTDVQAAVPLTALHFGEVNTNQQLAFDIYVKNTGNAPATAGVKVSEDTEGWLTWSFTPSPQLFHAGQVIKFTFTGTVTQTVQADTFKSGNFEVYSP